MNVNDVKKQIQSKRFSDRFFVFTGEEIEAQRIYVNKIAEVTGKTVKRIDEVKEAFTRRASILKVSNVFVCRDDQDFWKAATDPELIRELLGDNILILLMTNIDKRSKSYKSYSNQIIEFNYMDADVLYKYVQKECKLSDDNTYKLIDMCENSYSKILLECDKIKQFTEWLVNHGYDETPAEVYLQLPACYPDSAFEYLVQNGVIHRPDKDAIFDFVDAMLRADIDRAFSLLEECKGIGEPPLRIISVLYTNFKRVLQVQVCEDRDVCATTGLSAWDVKLAKQTVGCWRSEDLVFFLKTLQRVEQGVKSGEVEEGIALDLLMVSIL